MMPRGDRAGDLAGLVAAHAVGDTEHHRLGDEGVLVPAAHQPDVGGRAPAHSRLIGEGDVVAHHSASNTVLPICTRSPLATCSGAVSRLPFKKVPLVEPRSSIIVDAGVAVDAGVQLRDERVVGHADRARRGAADGDLLADRERRAACRLRFE